MIKFFRKIRYDLIETNKTSKYFRYAIGEIVLVVIGILIALQINNWNENKNKSYNAKEFISDLKKDIRSDTTVFGEELLKIERLIEYKKWILNTRDFEDIPIEYIEGLAQIGYHNIKISTGTIIRMRNSDVWNTSKYRNLFKSINAYYTFYDTYLNNINEWEKKGSEKEFGFWNEQDLFEIRFSSIDSIPVIQDEKQRKQRIIQIVSSIKGRNYIKLGLMREKTMNITYKRVYAKAKELLVEIEELTKDK